MTRLILYRHGRTAWNVTGRVQGQLDIDLDEIGVGPDRPGGAAVAAFAPDVIISSDLRRAARTAAAVAALTGQPVMTSTSACGNASTAPGRGSSTPRSRSATPASTPAGAWSSRSGSPTSRSVPDLGKRMLAAMQDAVAAVGPDGTALLVTHGGAARAGLRALCSAGRRQMLRTIGALGNCHYAELRLADARGWQLRAHNVG